MKIFLKIGVFFDVIEYNKSLFYDLKNYLIFLMIVVFKGYIDVVRCLIESGGRC